LLTDTLETLDLPARGQFLQRYLRAVTHLDLRESQCLQLWEEIITRRRQLSEALHRTVSLKTALMDVFSTAGLLRVPVLIEYDELKKLNLNAVTDSLTELYNRRVFNEFFERELNRAKRYNQPLGLVMMDMHRFKEVNDKHGHPRGDEVLRMAADTLKKALRTSDFAFRIGGDEFALVLPQTDAPQSQALSRRIETVFADTLKSLQLNVTVGMDYGVANYPQDADNTEELVRIADERLYQRKHAHRVRPAESPAPRPVETAPAQPPVTPPVSERPASTPAPTPISIETKRTPEKQEEAAPPANPQFYNTAQGGTRLHDRHKCLRRTRRTRCSSRSGIGSWLWWRSSRTRFSRRLARKHSRRPARANSSPGARQSKAGLVTAH
jgi:diguanylate cyclase (GGDEF)-like protein